MSYTRESRSSTSAVTPKCSTRGSIILQRLLLLLSVQHEGVSSFNVYCYFQVFNTRESRVEVFAYVRPVHSHWFGVVLVSSFTGACLTAYFPSRCRVYNFPICSQVFSITPPSTLVELSRVASSGSVSAFTYHRTSALGCLPGVSKVLATVSTFLIVQSFNARSLPLRSCTSCHKLATTSQTLF